MDDFKILLTGDYWHADFQDLIRDNQNATTLLPIENLLESANRDSDYSLIVIAQSRRNQFPNRLIEDLYLTRPQVPVVALSGSWCEGESRSGTPIPGLIRVYWHQWQGRLDSFCRQLASHQTATWQLPRTYSIADQILYDRRLSGAQFEGELVIGISALTPNSHEMLKDVCDSARLESVWVDALADDEELEVEPAVILADGNSMTNHLVERIRRIRTRFPAAATIVTLNFPRRYDFDVAQREGILRVVSKPFILSDLHSQIFEIATQGSEAGSAA